ncbi:MAG: domain 2 [Acidobacteriota bacterium]|nr:domain 2 [Acidobacteriota bacterium]
MSIYIYNNQQAAGPYDDNAVVAWLPAGQISPDAPACRQGANEWQPLRNLIPGAPQPGGFPGAQPNGSSPMPPSQAVVHWARQSFPAPVEVRLKFADVGRGELAKLIDGDGVETRGGQRHRWETLHYISYRKELRRVRSPIAALVLALMTKGQQKLSVRLTFQTGDAVVTPLMHNSNELLALFETIPVERRKF